MKKAKIEIEGGIVIVDGMKMTFESLGEFLYEMAHPDPRKWYNFERIGNMCHVHVEMREATRPVTDYPIPTEAINGNYVTERSPGFSSQGSQPADPLHEHRTDGQ